MGERSPVLTEERPNLGTGTSAEPARHGRERAAPERAASERAASERAARGTLRGQIARLERELSDTVVTAFAMRADVPAPPPVAAATPRLLDLGELEQVRDDLARRLAHARAQLATLADEQADKRLLVERMRLEPGRHRFVRVAARELGEPGCGFWQVRPRLGLIGMLMGWWQVKLSSGCPLARGRGPALRPPRP